jgi:hypothetical protein
MRIARRRNMMVFNNYANRAPSKPDSFQGYELYNIKQVGAVEAGLVEPVVPRPTNYNLTRALISSLDLILNYAATSNLGPTRSSRIYYLWFFSVATAYQWAQSSPRISGTKDGWNWSTLHPVGSQLNLCVWILSALEVINAKFVAGYTAPWSALSAAYLMSDSELDELKINVKTDSQFSVWSSAYATWWSARAADGHAAAAVPPTDAELPNGATRLDVGLTQDPAAFPSPESWAPLKIGAASQKYLTYNWLNVTSPAALTADNQNAIDAAANVYYPDVSERTNEIAEVVSIANTLTDTQKVIAEFWAGGPFTVSPPGMMIWMWKHYVYGKNSQPDLFVWSGLDLSLHLFEMGRIVWGLKKAHMEARPIQEIRRLYRGQTVKKYDGTDILGESWVPYQETNFVTPPFADFPSGHSAYSRCFANVMNAWFGTSIDSAVNVNLSDITLISPALSPQTVSFGSFVVGTGASLIQPGAVPSAPISLVWSTWNDLAESAGISRKYGGIHATSAHTGSVAAADALHSALNTNFPIPIV